MRENTFLYMRHVLGQVGQMTFEKDLDLQVEIAVMEQLGNVLEDGKKNIVWTFEKNVQQGLMRFLPLAVIS